MRFTLHNAVLVTARSVTRGSLTVDNGRIAAIRSEAEAFNAEPGTLIDLQGRLLFAGGIDAHVHFREPGLTHKADIASESRAALLGGYTAFIDMPNTLPPATTPERLREKCTLAAGRSWCHYAFHRGAANGPGTEVPQPEEGISPALKVFLGSSTGDMLVDDPATLGGLFRLGDTPILIHSEDEGIIRANLAAARERYGDDIPVALHPLIRSREACIASTRRALDAALREGTRLHILHVSTREEVEMIREAKKSSPRITAETSVNYLWFSDRDYERLGTRLKCNPAVKTALDRAALLEAVRDGTIDTIGSDHAPHLIEEKNRPYTLAPSGMPSIQEALPALMTLAREQDIPLPRIASLISEKAAEIFRIAGRGHLAVGQAADHTVIDPDSPWRVGTPAYKCGWTPYEGARFTARVTDVWLDGHHAVADGNIIGQPSGQPLSFNN